MCLKSQDLSSRLSERRLCLVFCFDSFLKYVDSRLRDDFLYHFKNIISLHVIFLFGWRGKQLIRSVF